MANGTTNLDHLTIFVRDIARPRGWYTGVFGLEVEFEVSSPKAVALSMREKGG